MKTELSVPRILNATHLAGQAYEFLKEAILEGRLPPGTPLSRRRLAEDLGMSPVPIGDAIARLEGEGLVESKPQAGTRVRIPTAEEIHGNYVLREALETHSARLFAEVAAINYRKRVLKAAEELDRAFNELARAKDPTPERHARVERIHIGFHMLVAEATGVPVLTNAIERSRVLLFNWIYTVSADFRPFPVRWHRDLAHALAKGYPQDAAEAMRIHVTYRQEEVIARFAKFSEPRPESTRMTRAPRRKAEANP